MKLCINCQHHTLDGQRICTRDSYISPVDGKAMYRILYCEHERSERDGGNCGPEGRYYIEGLKQNGNLKQG